MPKPAKLLATTLSAATLLTVGGLAPQVATADNHAADLVKKGKEVAFNRRTGNCLACHAMDDGESPGNIGPPLIAMKARFPDKAKLRAQIWDATARNPNSPMPPFGKHGALSEADIDAIVEYLYTL